MQGAISGDRQRPALGLESPTTASVEICTKHEKDFDQNTAQMYTAWDSTERRYPNTIKGGFGETSHVAKAMSQPIISIEKCLDIINNKEIELCKCKVKICCKKLWMLSNT